MKKLIDFSSNGINSRVGKLLVNRLVPNRYLEKVGPFVFLDHLYPTEFKPAPVSLPSGDFAHPHRGIATFTYVFSGALEHYDSYGHYGVVEAGGAQWMKAGNGIIHDEFPALEFQQKGGILHGVQFWVNLPAKVKEEKPEYRAIHSAEIPEVQLPEEAGTLRVVIGDLLNKQSPVPTYTPQFLYHIRLNPKSHFRLETQDGLEYAAFVPKNPVTIQQESFSNSQLAVLQSFGDEIFFSNEGVEATDVLLFGGAPFTEPMVAEGPFVMSSRKEITTAYRDFFDGAYGTITYRESLLQTQLLQ